MGKYFYLQCKRLVRSLPGGLCVVLALCLCLGLLFSMTVATEEGQAENQQISVGITGQTDDFFFQLGLQALDAYDSSRFTLELQPLSEEEAQAALSRGDIALYAVIPEGFMDAAMYGQIIPIRLVTTAGGTNMVTVFKDEVTRMITQVLVNSQKGVYGMADALTENGLPVGDHMNQLALQYVDYILLRDRIYTVQELGIGDRLPLREYLLCGLSVLFIWLSCLAFAPKLLRPAPALGQLLRSRGKSLWGQLLCDFGAYFLMLLPIAALPLLGGWYLGILQAPLWVCLCTVLAVALLCGSMSFFLYQLTDQLLSGVLLQFFVTLGMCFLCGCMYPVFFFPEALQRLSAWLPAGLARTLLAGCITGEVSPGPWFALLGYSCVFLALSRLARKGADR